MRDVDEIRGGEAKREGKRTTTDPRLVVRVMVTSELWRMLDVVLGPRRILLLRVATSRDIDSCDSSASSKSRCALRRCAFSRDTSSSASSSWRFRAFDFVFF